jgi:hypothetical protein
MVTSLFITASSNKFRHTVSLLKSGYPITPQPLIPKRPDRPRKRISGPVAQHFTVTTISKYESTGSPWISSADRRYFILLYFAFSGNAIRHIKKTRATWFMAY